MFDACILITYFAYDCPKNFERERLYLAIQLCILHSQHKEKVFLEVKVY